MHDSITIALLSTGLTMAIFLQDADGTRDKNVRPAEVRSFSSPSGQFLLEIRAIDHWSTSQVEAEMFEIVKGGESKSIWRDILPHRYGVRTAVVDDIGQTVLLDEWFRSVGRMAIILLEEKGKKVQQYSFSDVAKISHQEENIIVNTARVGAWMSAEPIMLADGKAIRLQAAGVSLTLNLENGRLSRTPTDIR